MNTRELASLQGKIFSMAEKKARRSFIPAFFQLLEDKIHPYIISWTEDGKSVMLKDLAQFGQIILPEYFGNTKYASFIRQLSFYGFKRVSKSYAKGHIYYNENFCRGRSDLLNNIQRKSKKNAVKEEHSQPESSIISEEPSNIECQSKHDELLSKLKMAHEMIKDLECENLKLKRIIQEKNSYRLNMIPHRHPGVAQSHDFLFNPMTHLDEAIQSVPSRRYSYSTEQTMEEYMRENYYHDARDLIQPSFMTNLYETSFKDPFDIPCNHPVEISRKPQGYSYEDNLIMSDDIAAEWNANLNPNFGIKNLFSKD